jgi:hypothetical protein
VARRSAAAAVTAGGGAASDEADTCENDHRARQVHYVHLVSSAR